LEVIVSLAVMAVGLVAVLEAFGAASRLSLQDEYLTTGTFLASSKMQEIEKETVILPMSDQGNFGEEFPDFAWSVEIADGPITGLEIVTVTVFWEAAGRPDELTLTSALPRREPESETSPTGASPPAGGSP
jgi:hypothetical protein